MNNNTTETLLPEETVPSKNSQLPNNGSFLATIMHEDDQLKDGMSVEDVEKLAIISYGNQKVFKNDDFWEDFLYTAFELNYKLKI